MNASKYSAPVRLDTVDNIVSDLGNFASHFLSRSQVQLDRFARTALEDAGDGGISLQSGLVLSRRGGAGQGGNEYYNKK